LSVTLEQCVHELYASNGTFLRPLLRTRSTTRDGHAEHGVGSFRVPFSCSVVLQHNENENNNREIQNGW